MQPSVCEVLSLETFATLAKTSEGLHRWDVTDFMEKEINKTGQKTNLMVYAIELAKQRSRNALPGQYLRSLARLSTLTLETQLKRREGICPWMGSVNGENQFIFSKNRYRVPKETEHIFRFLKTQKRFKVVDLPIEELDIDKIEMCRELIQDGFLEFAL